MAGRNRTILLLICGLVAAGMLWWIGSVAQRRGEPAPPVEVVAPESHAVFRGVELRLDLAQARVGEAGEQRLADRVGIREQKDATVAVDRLDDAVNEFVAMEGATTRSYQQLHHDALSALHRICSAVLDCEDAPRWAGHEQNWIDLLRRPDEVWQSHRVWAGDLPATADAYHGYVLTGSHHSVNDATQAWLAAKAGASYVSPFVGRLDDIGAVGMTLVREIVDIFDSSEYATEVLVASVRSPIHVIEAARMGADVVTVPPAVIEQCFKHPLTDIGLEKFLKDWEKAQGAKV